MTILNYCGLDYDVRGLRKIDAQVVTQILVSLKGNAGLWRIGPKDVFCHEYYTSGPLLWGHPDILDALVASDFLQPGPLDETQTRTSFVLTTQGRLFATLFGNGPGRHPIACEKFWRIGADGCKFLICPNQPMHEFFPELGGLLTPGYLTRPGPTEPG